jgi:hypothetical protein
LKILNELEAKWRKISAYGSKLAGLWFVRFKAGDGKFRNSMNLHEDFSYFCPNIDR